MHIEKRTLVFSERSVNLLVTEVEVVPVRTVDSYGTVLYKVGSKLHREDGPAIVCPEGSKWWCVNGLLITEEEHDAWRKENVSV